MNDNELFELFQTGTAPERDPLFAGCVNTGLRKSQIVSNVLTTVKYACVAMLMIGSFILAQLYLPFITDIASELSESLSSLMTQIIIGVISSIVAFLRKSAY